MVEKRELLCGFILSMVAGGLAILTAGILLFAPNIIGLMTPNYVPPEELEESIEPIWGMLLLGGTLNIVLGGLIVSGACLSHFRKRNLIGGFLVLVPSALLCTAPNLAVPGLLGVIGGAIFIAFKEQ